MDEPIDIKALAAPLDGAAGPVGEDLRLAVDGSDFFTLKDLRAEARTAEREAASNPDSDTPVLEAGTAKWSELVELAARLLTGRTKDLEVAGWLCEGAARLDGFRGLADGLALVDALLQRYWDDGVFPSEDEDGVETRVAPVGGLLGLSGVAALLQPIKLLPISDRDRDVALWSLASAQAPLQGDDAAARERAGARRTERMEQVRAAVRRSSPAFLRGTYGQIKAALASIDSLVGTVDRLAQTGRFGAQVVEPLQTALAFYEEQVKDVLVEAAPLAETGGGEAEAVGGSASSGQGAPATPGRIGGREDAYATILRVADFFESSEPHSLVARSLREVVRRGRLSIDELLAELLPEADQRVVFLQRAGVKFDPPVQESPY